MLLTKEDLVEMNLPIGVRNKVLTYLSNRKNQATLRGPAPDSGLKVMELMMKSIVAISKNTNVCACPAAGKSRHSSKRQIDHKIVKEDESSFVYSPSLSTN